jgi:type 2 lantibiotic biosynthesis protein LanM
LIENYPVLNEKLKRTVSNFTNHILQIINRFQIDIQIIIKKFKINKNFEELEISEIDISVGDGHNGEGTAIIYLSDGTRLIYKPRNIEVTNSYNAFIKWINHSLNVDLQVFKILSRKKYGWLEFVKYEEIDSESDLKEYYFKAGILLAVTLLLGSKDCHSENIIAAGKNPILIDHETIIQPYINTKLLRSWDEEHKIPHFSVLESALIVNFNTGVPSDWAGYGVTGQLETIEIKKKVIHPNTTDSKRVTRFVNRKLIKNNIPRHRGNYVFVDQFGDDFCNGFSMAYDLFLNSKGKLKSENSPIKQFINKKIRYVWRPTFVYFNILKHLENAAYMRSFEEYQSRLFNLLSKAYEGEHMNEYKFILKYEMTQMLRGDIPIFNLDSEDCFLEENLNLPIFKTNCITSIYHRIDFLSFSHKQNQLQFINKWVSI